jgi:hypothetical protein
MGQGVFSITVPNTSVPTRASRGLQTGILRSVAATVVNSPPGSASIIAELYLTKGGEDTPNSFKSLSSGIIQRGMPQQWDGYYQIEGDELLCITAQADSETLINVTFNTDLKAL